MKRCGITVKKILIGCSSVFLISVIAFVSLVIWFYCELNDNLSKKEIFNLVNKNYAIILEDIKENDFSDSEKIKGIKDISCSESYIDFYCGGRGMGSETSYFGFYYSEKNAIDVKENFDYPKGEVLKQDGKGYSWDEVDGDNRFYVEKIMDGFFYYETHY